MHRDCIQIGLQHYVVQCKRARLVSPPYLVASDKGREPFASWSIDCIVGLPEAEGGETVLMVAVDM